MTRPPKTKTAPSAPIKTTIRLAPDVHAELLAAAEENRRSINAELLARVHGSQLGALRREIAELKAMLREVLDLVRDRQ